LFEKREVVLWNQYRLCLSVSRELDTRTRSRSPNDAREILARRCGCYLLSHAANVVSNPVPVNAWRKAFDLQFASRKNFSCICRCLRALEAPRFAREAILGRR
jgi:hypothetical protein